MSEPQKCLIIPDTQTRRIIAKLKTHTMLQPVDEKTSSVEFRLTYQDRTPEPSPDQGVAIEVTGDVDLPPANPVDQEVVDQLVESWIAVESFRRSWEQQRLRDEWLHPRQSCPRGLQMIDC